ncbi:hypothetical protein JA33_291 [Dickeya phage vB_DsoM_JA33]|uniref:Uncharacterized protein n=2 Tax=Salmondvirus JA11 TaxID=2734141 RepID=A0A386K5Y2_9CAUD|nr:hypothetical protein HOU32_gp290 [Dickeya phage vB_DsoM_JA11]AXG67665.1 hypothetical protein JA33_291 [Dickeya phage vB_DsoM_JA33]AYD80095.1 hypothetical protein JA11_290 [Dickeya phage vB_DsoM_JA11]
METISIRVKRAEVLVGNGVDKVVLVTELPLGVAPFNDEGQTLEFKVAAGKGVLYVQKHFNLNPKVTRV